MANTLRFKRGLVSTIPTALAGEPLFTTDTFDLYIGNGTTNTRFQKYIASGTTSQLLRGDGSLLTMPIVLTSPANGEVLKYNGTNWVNSSDAGVTGSGTTNYIPKFASSTTLNNSSAYDSGAGITVERAGDVTLGVTATAPGSTSIYLTPNGGGFGQLSTLGSTHLRLGTNGTERARFTAGGNFLVGGTSDNGLRFQVTGDGYFSGSVGIGVSSLTGTNLYITKAITGGAIAYGMYQFSAIQSDVTSQAHYFRTLASTANTTFTLNTLFHYRASQITFGASSTVNNQYGFAIDNLTGATNNYGFYSEIASGTGRWNLYMNGTANNYLAGRLGIGTTAPTTSLHVISGTLNSDIAIFSGQNLDRGLKISTFSTGTNDAGVILNAQTSAQSALAFSTNSVERMRLDASGDLGLGVTPSAWGTTNSVRALQLASGSIWNFATTNFFIGQNYYYDGTNRVYVNTNAATEYAQITGSHIWYNAPSGTAGTTATLTERMRLDASGNLGLGVVPSAWNTSSTYRALDISNSFGLLGGGGSADLYFNLFFNASSQFIYKANGSASAYSLASGQHRWYNVASGTAGAVATLTQAMTLFPTGNLAIGTTTDAGFRLDVNGTMRVSGASTVASLSTSAGTIATKASGTEGGQFQFSSLTMGYDATNNLGWITAAGAAARTNLALQGGGGNVLIGTISAISGASSTRFVVVQNQADWTQLIKANTTTGNSYGLRIDAGTNASDSAISINNASATTNFFNINGTGAATFSSTAQAAGFITSGGTGYAVINSAATTVTALRPTGGGASIMSTNSNGLHIAVGTQASGDLILASNNTERIRLSSNGFFSQLNATNPSASITDSYIQYSADVVAGNASPHFRTENGAVIKLYQETTGVGNAIFSQGGGNAVLDDSTFDGYTLRQIVKALRNQGILA